jgi:endonuclease-3
MARSARPVAGAILDALERHYPDADTELHYRTPFELLVATVLSAQSTDARVNMVTPALFARFPDAAAMAGADPAELEALIHATGFFRQKARAVVGLSETLVEQHGGEVPAEMAALTALPGVGRKTANVVLGHALGVPGLPVDRHVLRVANRLGIAHGDDPVKVEAELTGQVPPARWTKASDLLILHGRRICRPAPLCDRCNARPLCQYAITGMAQAATRPRTGKAAGDGSAGRRPATAAKAPKPTKAAKVAKAVVRAATAVVTGTRAPRSRKP